MRAQRDRTFGNGNVPAEAPPKLWRAACRTPYQDPRGGSRTIRGAHARL